MKRNIYIPMTAAPWKRDQAYQEMIPKSLELTGSIRCFWGSGRPFIKTASDPGTTVVIPDTCADIIYQIDHTENTVTGIFCGINDRSFIDEQKAKPGNQISVFGIRFYAWAASAFSEDSLKGTVNGCCDVQSRFCWLDGQLRQQLFETRTLEERGALAEELLLRHSRPPRQHRAVEDGVNQILLRKGNVSAAQLAGECFISSRQLERLFHDYIGITPKKLCSLVRYQCLWNQLLKNPGLDLLDAVYQYGYADQSHLIREFKRYHTMNIQSAVGYAYKHVGNIQDSPKAL